LPRDLLILWPFFSKNKRRERGREGGKEGGREGRAYLEGVDDVAERLAHFAAVLVADHGVEVDGLEG